MEVDPAKLQAARVYVFDYVAGLLWLLAVVVASATTENIRRVASWTFHASQSLPPIEIPELIVGFLLTIGGIVIPYCFAQAVKPLTLRLMTLLVAVARLPARREAGQPGLHDKAEQIVRHRLGLADSYRIERHVKLVYLVSLRPALAQRIEASMHDVWFRASSTLPASLFFAAVAYRVFELARGAGAVVAGVLMFTLGTWFLNRERDSWEDQLNTSIILLSKGTEKEVTPNPGPQADA